jgi:hypothetical protein
LTGSEDDGHTGQANRGAGGASLGEGVFGTARKSSCAGLRLLTARG